MSSRRIELSSVICIDTACAILALFIAAGSGHGSQHGGFPSILQQGIPLLFVAMLLWLLISDRLALNQFYRSRSELVSRAIVATIILGTGIAALSFVVKGVFSRVTLLGFLFVFFVGVVAVRLAIRAVRYRKIVTGKRRRAVILGSGYIARELARALEHDQAMRYDVIGYLSPESEKVASVIPRKGTQDTIAAIRVSEYLAIKKVDQLFLVLPNSGDPEVLKIVAECRNADIEVAFVPHAYELYVSRTVLRSVGGIPFVATEKRRVPPHSAFLKRLADCLIAASLLVITAPLMAITSIVLSIRHRKPFRGEVRCGQSGRHFTMYCFNNERSAIPLNRLDSFLHATSISELPQLWNVLRGEMSMVGPRPEPPERATHYSEWLNQRLVYKPGITGLAQVHGLREWHSSPDKARLDLQYPLSWSPLLDLTLIVQTLWIVARRVFDSRSPARSDSRSRHSLPTELETAHANSSQSGAD